MKKTVAVVLVVCLSLLPCALAVMQGVIYFTSRTVSADLSFDLPAIYIQTQDGKLPTDKENYVSCSFEMTNTKNPDDAFVTDRVGIRLRGNSTFKYDKKPYRIKFDKKQSFFGSEKNKSWVLLADYLDPSDMRNYTALELAREFENLEFTPSANHVVLYLNGEFKGLYLLSDQVDEKAGRVGLTDEKVDVQNLDIPFMIEMDHEAAKDGTIGVDCFYVDGYQPVEIKYPEVDDYDPATWQKIFNYIESYVTSVFALLHNHNQGVVLNGEMVYLDDLLDDDSLIDFLLVNEIMGNFDSKEKSIYMYRHTQDSGKAKSGLLRFGPVWDFDACAVKKWRQYDADLATAERILVLDGQIASDWLAIGKNQQKLYDRYLEKRMVIIKIVNMLNDYHDYIAPAARTDMKLWYGVGGDTRFELQYQFLKDYLLLRYDRLAGLLRS